MGAEVAAHCAHQHLLLRAYPDGVVLCELLGAWRQGADGRLVPAYPQAGSGCWRVTVAPAEVAAERELLPDPCGCCHCRDQRGAA
ncbi:MAG: hypothetical protein HY690_01060 [Chloroflexi bacterium]|nr:hypothetical protein [Chloroflexota bacterium]